ncbi:MAG: hypothetical protein LBB60_04110 [Desulfovibrio sp.]|jgi:hypothetical protein|nr:hypothetical protein [Desulfovibrio sp.]
MPDTISDSLLAAYYADDQPMLKEWLPKYEELTGEKHEVAHWLEEDAEDEADLAVNGEEYRRGLSIPWEDLKKELGL